MKSPNQFTMNKPKKNIMTSPPLIQSIKMAIDSLTPFAPNTTSFTKKVSNQVKISKTK